MNIIDRAIAIFNPKAALQREVARVRLNMLSHISHIQNSGYSESGASRVKKSMKGWTADSKSPQEDIDDNLQLLRVRSRDLWMSSPLATSAIKTQRTNVVGSGLKLKSRIDYKTLGITPEEAQEWEIKTEKEFNLWAESRWCDSQRLNNFYEMQQIQLIAWLMNGDAISLPRHEDPTPWMPYGLRLYNIESDRVCSPQIAKVRTSFYAKTTTSAVNKDNGNPIYSGIEVDKDTGAVEAYWICNQYPDSTNHLNKKWVRIEAFGKKTGNPNVLRIMDQERCEQYRGVPYLAPVIEALKQITRYTEAELMAAVVQSFFTAWITYKANATENPMNDVIVEDEQVDRADPNAYEMGVGTINILGENEDVKFGQSTHPNNGFEGFINSMAKLVGAALEIPVEVLMKIFMASYSASRGALLEAWKAFRMRRTWFSNDFCQPAYEMWLSEAVARERIIAPGFFSDPLIKKAYCSCEWIGPAPGMLDPVKEVTAAILRVDNAFSTYERETTELTGGNWDDNIAQVKREKELLRQLNPRELQQVSDFSNESEDGYVDKSTIRKIIKNQIERSFGSE